MANAFDTYTTTGPPERAHVRRAAVWDLGLVTIVFMILWPMPALRLTAGLPWSVHVPILRWALGWTAALLPTAFGAVGPADAERGWAARLSGSRLASTSG